MTEPEWLACRDPQALIEFLCNATVLYSGGPGVSEPRFCLSQRKLRLFACACCRRLFPHLPTEEMRQAVVLAEKQADGETGEDDLRALVAHIVGKWDFRRGPSFSVLAVEVVNSLPANRTAGPGTTWAALARFHAFLAYDRQMGGASSGKDYAPEESLCWRHAQEEEAARQADLLRDIIGNPFLAASVEEPWLRWNDRCLPRMARTIYDEGCFESLPVLADALEEAGCTDARLLAHCRARIEHVRGCWVLDALLGKP